MHAILGINHVTLAVGDLARSFQFYVEVVGLKPMARWTRGAYLLAGNEWICLSQDDQTRDGPLPEYTHLAFTIDKPSFRRCSERIQAYGAARWKDNRSEGDSLYFLDPDGHKLEIHVGGLESRLAMLREQPYEGLRLYTQDP